MRKRTYLTKVINGKLNIIFEKFSNLFVNALAKCFDIAGIFVVAKVGAIRIKLRDNLFLYFRVVFINWSVIIFNVFNTSIDFNGVGKEFAWSS